jgi:hypothetical protein
VQYHYFVCQKCGFIGGNSDFSHVHQTPNDYDVDFRCPICYSINIKRRVGLTKVDSTPLEDIELILKKRGRKMKVNKID